MGRLIAVSNRTAAGAGPQSGGLAVALWDALATSGGSWFGWSGEVVEEETRGLRSYAEEGVEHALIDLTQDEHDGYYVGYANRALWPILHYRVDLASFNEQEFRTYAGVNRRFAHLIAQRLRPDDTVWVHDYHFFLMGEALRGEGWSGPIGFFLHVPFPAPEVFRALPEHGRIAHALAQYDLVGFQTERDAENFQRYMAEEHGAEGDAGGALQVARERVRIGAFPIGIDADDFARMAVEEQANKAAQRIGRFLGDRELVIGVDRLDYSKGLPQRFEAIGRLFDNYPEARQRLSVTQIAPPSRSKVEEYIQLRGELDQLAGRVNGDYGDLDWIPIRYLARGYPRGELAGLFRLARAGLVTPLHDGMNLVAKEYVVAQDPEDPGVLVLSQFAGAAEQLTAALLVNPHDPAHMADALMRALDMPLEERQTRWRALNDVVRTFDVSWWRRQYLTALADAVKPPAEAKSDVT